MYRAPLHSASGRFGFTLIELSIVLVIIGLIVGGALVGKELIHAAQLRAVITEVDSLKTAITMYNLKYQALPGDHSDAKQFFGDNCPDLPASNTCNGDGNQFVNYTGYEIFRVGQHLALAGLIGGTFTGQYDGNPHIQYPASKYHGGFYAFAGQNLGSYWGASRTGNRLVLAAYDGSQMVANPIMNTGDAYYIDSKMDDGQPGTGSVYVLNAAMPPGSCTDKNEYDPAPYNWVMAMTVKGCKLFFWY